MNSTQALKSLNLTNSASKADVKSAYRKLAMKYHPDRGEGSSEAKFKEVKAAFEYLDKYWSGPQTSSAGRDYSDVKFDYNAFKEQMNKEYSKYSGQARGASGQARGARNYDYDPYGDYDDYFDEVEIVVPLKTAFSGGKIFSKRLDCDITIPPKTRQADISDHDEADIYFTVVTGDFNVSWAGSDAGNVRTTIKISILRLMMGGWVEFDNFDGTTISLFVPPGTNVDSVLRARGKGYYVSSYSERRGDLYLKISGKIESVDKIDPKEVEEFLKAIKRA